MSTATKDRRYADSLHTDAGWALRKCAPLQKHLSQALHVHKSWISRQVSGEPGVVGRFFEHLQALCAHRQCNPGPLLGEALVVMAEALEPLSDEEAEEVFRYAIRAEYAAQAREDEATGEVHYWMERTCGPDACPRDLERLSDALDEFDAAVAEEVGLEILKRVAGRVVKRRTVARLDR